MGVMAWGRNAAEGRQPSSFARIARGRTTPVGWMASDTGHVLALCGHEISSGEGWNGGWFGGGAGWQDGSGNRKGGSSW